MASKPQERPDVGIDLVAARDRLNAWKQQTGQSWADIARVTGIAQGTISLFGTGNYSGDNTRIAAEIERFFAAEAEAVKMRRDRVIEAPVFQPTRAAKKLFNILHYARRGKMAAVAASPGFGKSSALSQFKADVPNTYLATMSPSSAGVQPMLTEILQKMGEREVRGSPQMLSARIKERVQGAQAMLLIDEAQHLSHKALDELRSIHDATSVGVALFGNASLLELLEGGHRAVSHAQLYSRIGIKFIEIKAYPEDAQQLGRAWGIDDAAALEWLGRLSQAGGGLRTVTQVIELAMFLAVSDDQDVGLRHLQEAGAQLSARQRSI